MAASTGSSGLTIQPDGNITLEVVGTIRAAGFTPDELGKLIAEKAPIGCAIRKVVVSVVQYAPRKVFVGGEVNAPGPVLIQEGMTPMQAIFDRGGFKDTAQRDGVVLIRDGGSENPQIGRIDLFTSLENGTPEVITLLTNDVIYVPMTGIRPRQYLDKAAFKGNPPHGTDRFRRHGRRIVTATVIRRFILRNYSEWAVDAFRDNSKVYPVLQPEGVKQWHGSK